jgi:integrase
MRTLDVDEIQMLLGKTEETIYHPLFHLAIYSGLRRSELLALRWKQIDVDMAVLYVVEVLHRLNDGRIIFDQPKSRNGRRPVSLSPDAVLSLRRHRERQEQEATLLGVTITGERLVFSQPDGSPLLPDSVSHAFTRIAQRAGINGVRLHDLRHTHATLMLQQGIHPKIVSERLGHGSIAITLDTYSHVVPGLQEAAAKRFDEAMLTKC